MIIRRISSSAFNRFCVAAPAILLAFLFAMAASVRGAESSPPKVGDRALDFTLQTLDERTITLSELLKNKPVVLVVLRGWPGYQCPLCTRQVHEFTAQASAFAAKGAHVVMLYPGPADDLRAHAEEFLKDKSWPDGFTFVLDPDYTLTRQYGLRWEAPRETAYPSTFVIGQDGAVKFAQVSRTHGDRAKTPAVLAALAAMK